MTGSVPRVWTADQVLGQLLSTSYFNPGRLGDRQPAFEADLRARLSLVEPGGVFTEELGFLALVATRPSVETAFSLICPIPTFSGMVSP
jgi:hypothetical protein